jgi:tRNA dimethylallyltransferase
VKEITYVTPYHAYSVGAAGFRDFEPYLRSNRASDHVGALFDQGVETMKLATRKYAKRQVSWLKNKLVPAVHAANVAERLATGRDIIPMYLLDATGGRPNIGDRLQWLTRICSELGEQWMTNVQAPATSILEGWHT